MTAELIDRPSIDLASDSATPASRSSVRVLHVVNGEHYSGAERVQDLLGQRLGDYGYDVGYACLKLGRFAALRQARDAELYDAPMRSRFDFRPVMALCQIIRKYNYQIVHTHTARSALVGSLAAAICRVPHVHHLHSPTSLDSTRWLTNRANMAIERYSLRRADAIIAVSHSLTDYAKQQHLGGGLAQMVHNGVPTQGPLKTREIPSATWTIGTLALFRPRKGLEVLLSALAKLRDQGLPVRLRAVGAFETTDYEIRIKTLADQLGVTTAIDWTGFTSNVAAEFAKMDIFVLPSLFGEGLPMVILEAMAAGVPVVATRVEGAPEAIRDTVDGLLAEANDPADLAARIADIVQGRLDWQSLRESAHQRQAQKFSDHSMAKGVANVYSQVLDKRGSKGRRPDAASTATSIDLMGTRIDNVTMPEAIKLITQGLDVDTPSQVCFVNADCINITYRSAEYRQVLADADLVFADGIGMKIAGKVMRRPIKENVNGTDLFPRLCLALSGSGKRVFLLGGKPGVADDVAKWISTHVPGLDLCGVRDGYFKPQDESAVVSQIAESEADLLLVALGAPRQDQWIHEHLQQLGCKVAIGVGGLFDFYSGRVSRAPQWLRTLGLEWLYRTLQEPRRLAKRYLLGNPAFLIRVLCERLFGQRTVVKPHANENALVSVEKLTANADA